MEKFWTWVEKIKLYRVLHEHRLFGKIVNREVISYLFFGAMTTLVSLITFYLPSKLFASIGYQGVVHYVTGSAKNFSYMESNVISWVCAVAFAFVTNKLFVFGSLSWEKKTAWRELLTFVGGRVATLFVDMALMFLFVTVIGMGEMLSKVIVQIVIIILNYVISKLLVFRTGAPKEETE